MTYRFPRTTEEHVKELAENLRPEDRAELQALSSKSVEETIRQSVARSDEVWTALADDTVIGMLGISPYTKLSGKACPWFLSTNTLSKHPKVLLRATKIAVEYWLTKYEEFECYVDSTYPKSVRWMEWAGFTKSGPYLIGPKQHPFYKMTMKREE